MFRRAVCCVIDYGGAFVRDAFVRSREYRYCELGS